MSVPTTTVVIPARLASTRLPSKVLLDLEGRPILQRVWEQVAKMQSPHKIIVATDSNEVRNAAEGWGATVLMTSPTCQSGTERIVSIIDQIDTPFILNVQGDEPFISPELLDRMVHAWDETQADLITPIYEIKSREQLFDPNTVKAVRTLKGDIPYFSRAAIPYMRDTRPEVWHRDHTYWGHIGVYGYSRKILEHYTELPESPLEKIEALEQLRFIDAGHTFHSVVTSYHPIAIDTESDLQRARHHIQKTPALV